MSLCIQFDCGNILTRMTPNTDTFHAVIVFADKHVIRFLTNFMPLVSLFNDPGVVRSSFKFSKTSNVFISKMS